MENTTDPFDDNMTEPISCPFGWDCIEADDEEEILDNIVDNLVNWREDGMPDDVPSKD